MRYLVIMWSRVNWRSTVDSCEIRRRIRIGIEGRGPRRSRNFHDISGIQFTSMVDWLMRSKRGSKTMSYLLCMLRMGSWHSWCRPMMLGPGLIWLRNVKDTAGLKTVL